MKDYEQLEVLERMKMILKHPDRFIPHEVKLNYALESKVVFGSEPIRDRMNPPISTISAYTPIPIQEEGIQDAGSDENPIYAMQDIATWGLPEFKKIREALLVSGNSYFKLGLRADPIKLVSPKGEANILKLSNEVQKFMSSAFISARAGFQTVGAPDDSQFISLYLYYRTVSSFDFRIPVVSNVKRVTIFSRPYRWPYSVGSPLDELTWNSIRAIFFRPFSQAVMRAIFASGAFIGQSELFKVLPSGCNAREFRENYISAQGRFGDVMKSLVSQKRIESLVDLLSAPDNAAAFAEEFTVDGLVDFNDLNNSWATLIREDGKYSALFELLDVWYFYNKYAAILEAWKKSKFNDDPLAVVATIDAKRYGSAIPPLRSWAFSVVPWGSVKALTFPKLPDVLTNIRACYSGPAFSRLRHTLPF